MAKGGQQGGSSYGWGSSGAPPWFGMASSYGGGPGYGGGRGYGGGPAASEYQQGGDLYGADPSGGSGGAFPTYMGPPRDQPLGAPPAPPTGGPTGIFPSVAAPAAATPGLLGGGVDASGNPMGSNTTAPPTQPNGQPNIWQSLTQGWHNRGYGTAQPVQAGQAGQAGGNMTPPQYQMPPQIQSILQGLFGGWGQGGGAPTGYM